MRFDSFTTLVLSGGGYQGLAIIKGLRQSSVITVIMADSSEENISKYFVDKYFCIPMISDEKTYIDSIVSIILAEDVNMIFPSTEIELRTLSAHHELFTKLNVKLAASSMSCLDTVCSKKHLYYFLINRGLPVLPLIDPYSPSTIYPVIGKPVRGWGSKGLLTISSRDELKHYEKKALLKNYVWQKLLSSFEEYSIDCAVSFDGTISPFVVRSRTKTVSGFAVISESVDEPEIRSAAACLFKILASEGACGIFNVQVIKDSAGFYFSDVNPRIGTSAVFANRAATNLPLFLCAYARPDLQLSADSPQSRRSVKMVRYLEELWFAQRDFCAVKVFIFDLDDTLLNQKQWIYIKLDLLWEKFRNMLPAREIFLNHALWILEEGNRSHIFDEIAVHFALSQAFKDDLINAYRAIAPKSFLPYEDVLPTLNQLKALGYTLVLLTDNPPESQRQKIKACHLEKYFDVIVFSQELNAEKPSEKVFDHISAKLGIPSSAMVMVGDNLYRDIKGALEAGYAHAYWINRKGTFFNFDDRLLTEISPHLTDRYSHIGSLREITNELSYSCRGKSKETANHGYETQPK